MMEELESGFLYKVLFDQKIVRWLDSTGIRMNAGRTSKENFSFDSLNRRWAAEFIRWRRAQHCLVVSEESFGDW